MTREGQDRPGMRRATGTSHETRRHGQHGETELVSSAGSLSLSCTHSGCFYSCGFGLFGDGGGVYLCVCVWRWVYILGFAFVLLNRWVFLNVFKMFDCKINAKPRPAWEGRAGAVQSRHRGAGVSQKPLLPGCAVPSQTGPSGTGCPLYASRTPCTCPGTPVHTQPPTPCVPRHPPGLGVQVCSWACKSARGDAAVLRGVHTYIHTYTHTPRHGHSGTNAGHLTWQESRGTMFFQLIE